MSQNQLIFFFFFGRLFCIHNLWPFCLSRLQNLQLQGKSHSVCLFPSLSEGQYLCSECRLGALVHYKLYPAVQWTLQNTRIDIYIKAQSYLKWTYSKHGEHNKNTGTSGSRGGRLSSSAAEDCGYFCQRSNVFLFVLRFGIICPFLWFYRISAIGAAAFFRSLCVHVCVWVSAARFNHLRYFSLLLRGTFYFGGQPSTCWCPSALPEAWLL